MAVSDCVTKALLCILFATALFLAAWKAANHLEPSLRPSKQKEIKAQARVTSLLRSRAEGAGANVANPGIMDFIPASSLEAQQSTEDHAKAEREFRAEFEEVLGKDLIGVFEEDLASIQKDLQSAFLAMPKNEYGELGHTAVRYLLHRLFVQRHGWYVHGLDPEGNNFNASSPSQVLKGRVPDHVEKLIEKMLYGRGFGLVETAVLGAFLENLIHQEAIGRARRVFKMHRIPFDALLDTDSVDFVVDNYMVIFTMVPDIAAVNKRQLALIREDMSSNYPGWDDSVAFTRKLREDKFGSREDVTFQETLSLLLEISEKHGRFQNAECMVMKEKLMALETQKDGCVPMANFYRDYDLEGKWQFSEGSEYLRELGALDETDPKNMRLMIPNYVDSPSNCLSVSAYFSVCCINEGEAILGRIEKHFEAPAAKPEELIRVVAALPSSTVAANRTLPPALVERLEKIAAVHGGEVPLHSRLFSQWMHSAYPHEFVYPQVSGKRKPRTPEAWMNEKHEDPLVKPSELRSVRDAGVPMQQGAQCGKWLDVEELYVPWKQHPMEKELEKEAHAWAAASAVAMLGSVASMILMLIQTAKTVRSSPSPHKMLAV